MILGMIGGGGQRAWAKRNTDAFKIIAPPDLFAVVGVEANVHFDNLIRGMAGKDLINWDISGGAGSHVSGKWTDTPSDTTDDGDTLTVTAYDVEGAAVDSHNMTYNVAPLERHGDVNLLWIGDSTSPESLMEDIATHASGDSNLNLNLIGTQGTIYKNEGYGGKTASWFYTHADSPFTKAGVFDFASYLTDNSLDTPGLIIIQLGINDIFGQTNDGGVQTIAAANFAIFESMFSAFIESNSAVKIFLNLISLASDQTDMGGDYGDGQTAWRYKRNAQVYNRAMLDYDWPHYVTIVAAMHNVDFENEMSNGVHPGATGYQSIADAAYAAIKNNLPTGISYHDGTYNDATRTTSTDNFTVSGSTLTTILSGAQFNGAEATFKCSKKTSYRIAGEFAKGPDAETLYVGIKIWNGSTAVDYDLPPGSQGIFTAYLANLNYTTTGDAIKSVDTTIDLSLAPDFDHISIHVAGYKTGETSGVFATMDLSSLAIEAQ